MDNRFYFGFGAFSLRDVTTKQILGSSRIVGNLTADISTPLVETMGGAASFSTGARQGRGTGDLTVTLNERPAFIDRLLNEGSQVDTAAAGSATAGTITDAVGSGLAAKLVVEPKSGADPFPGAFTVTATGAAALRVEWVGAGGAGSVDLASVGTSPLDIGNTGMTIEASTASPSFTVDNVAVFEVAPAHGGIVTISIPQVRRGKSYGLIAYSAPGGDGDKMETVSFPNVVFAGASYTLTDNEPSNGVELTGKVLAPADGGSVMVRESLTKA